MITVFWDIVGVILVDVMARGETTRTRTSKPSKNWNSFTGECGLTGIQKTCWFSMTMPALTQVYEPRGQWPSLVRLCSPSPYIPDMAPSGFHLFGHWRIHCVGKVLKIRARFVQWCHGYANRKWAGTGKACMPLFHSGVRPWTWMEIVGK